MENDNKIVKYHNRMNEVKFGIFNEKELDIFFSIVYRMQEQGDNVVVLSFDELRKLSGYSHRSTERFAKKLMLVYDKMISLNFRIDLNKDEWIRFVLFTQYKVSLTDKTISIKVNEDFRFILNELSSFTRFELDQFLDLQNKYSKQIYKFLKRFSDTKIWIISLMEFRELMYIPESYRIGEIDYKILKPAIEELREIEEFKDLYYEKVKNGREIASLKFIFSKRAKEIEYIPDSIETIKKREILKKKREKEAKIDFLKNVITEITPEEIEKLLDLADEKILLEKYYLMRNSKTEIKNLAGWLYAAIKEDYKPVKEINTNLGGTKSIGAVEKRLQERRLKKMRENGEIPNSTEDKN